MEQSVNLRNGKMLDINLMQHLKGQKAKSATKVVGPNGAFISWVNEQGVRQTIPVGRNSQAGKLEEFKLIQTEDNVLIATVNHYAAEETVTFEA